MKTKAFGIALIILGLVSLILSFNQTVALYVGGLPMTLGILMFVCGIVMTMSNAKTES